MVRGALPIPILLAVLFAALAPPSARGDGEELDEETEQLLRVVRYEDLAGSWSGAVYVLRNGTAAQRRALGEALHSVVKRRRVRLKKEASRVNLLVSRLGDGSKAKSAIATWDRRRKSALRWVLDPVSFPDPPGSRVYGPMAGSKGARTRCKAAIAAYAALAKHLDRSVGSAWKMGTSNARSLFLDYVLAYIDVMAVVDEMVGVTPPPTDLPQADPFALLLLDARLGQLPSLARAYEAEPEGWRKVCLFHAYCHGVLRFNEMHPCGMGEGAVKAIQLVNEIRIALGLSPAMHNGKLARMARAHQAEQVKLSYWGHRSPTPANRTTTHRAANAGYKGDVTECLALTSSPVKAIDIWYYDGAHFRGLVSPCWIECGLSNEKPVTWNAGSGDGGVRPCLRYGEAVELDMERVGLGR